MTADRAPSRPAAARGGPGTTLTVVGWTLVAFGLVLILRTLWMLPDAVREQLGSWAPAVFVVGGVVLLAAGRRLAGVVLTAVGALPLLIANVPGDLVWPVLLILAGVVVLAGTTGGRRWLGGDQGGVAVFDDVELRTQADGVPGPFVALFSDVRATLAAAPGEGTEPVSCLAVFGSVEVSVPRDVAVVVGQTAVFGDVRTPPPPREPAAGVLRMTAVAVFGDVRVDRRA